MPTVDLAAWTRLSLRLPRHHDAVQAGEVEPFRVELASTSTLDPAMLRAMPDAEARLLALDVLMVESFAYAHRAVLGLGEAHLGEISAQDHLDLAAQAVAGRLDIKPILSYPLYIRHNPTDLADIRRFTPLEAEFRFIRMHRLIEDTLDRVIARMVAVCAATDWQAALADAMPELSDCFRVVNRTMAGFRDPERMPREDFTHGFRPYYPSRTDPVTGQITLEGPSGLQSPTFRIFAMLLGYRDALMDGWTRRIASYHEPATRAWLADMLARRDDGRTLAGRVAEAAGWVDDLPHLHPAYGAYLPVLLDLAIRGGYCGSDISRTLKDFGVVLGSWPLGAPVSQPLPDEAVTGLQHASVDLSDATAAHLVECEAMLFGFHLEHIATTAMQIGHVQGTGGTSGVEFLALATFRRAFPWLWLSGLAHRVAGAVVSG